ncbi:MAG: metallophosphoesterase [Salinivirgaceae bacterium]|nr:metallophosphoesterase [Salinivirgaceae bacterium]
MLHERNGSLKWSACVFFVAIILYAAYEIAEHVMPLHGLPPLGERIGDIEKIVNPDNFCFAVIGDNKNDKKVFPMIITRINNDPDISFVIHTGDAVESSRKVSYWDFLETLDVRLHKPILLVPGNHDVGDDDLCERAFGQKQYVFLIGDTCLLFADIADASGMVSAVEHSWLRHALSQNAKNGNIIVFMHIPLYDPRSDGNHHCLEKRSADKLFETCGEYNVKHIFTGHIHGYWTGLWSTIDSLYNHCRCWR